MEAVDEIRERIQRDVLGKREPERDVPGPPSRSRPELRVGDSEERAVRGVPGEADGAPMVPADRLAEERDVRVVAAEEPLVDRLEDAPGSSRDRARNRRSRSAAHTLPSMPEGDTLHRAARRLQVLVGQRVEAEAPHPRSAVTGVAKRIDGLTLLAVEAAGKNLLLRFEGGVTVRSHLRMTGRWRVGPRGERRAGRPWLLLRGHEFEAVLWNGPVLELDTGSSARLGPDILADPPDLDGILARLRRGDPRREIGDALLDQRIVAGIGNIWRSEALWHARVSPWTPVGDLADDALRTTLLEASRLMRESVHGERPARRVYRRTGRSCARCGEPIRSLRQGDGARTAYWCPACQPLPAKEGDVTSSA